MALVILPCDLPYWNSLQKHLTIISTARNSRDLVDGMFKIFNMCNTGLDPDEPEKPDPTMFDEFIKYLDGLPEEENCKFFDKTLPFMTKRALDLKLLKPVNGFHFSLQQQRDSMEFSRSFIASLVAHAFFSTFPKRTSKTHPTLQDFNFTYFFQYLDINCQKAKLESIFHYFNLLEEITEDSELITFSRQVMPGREWLTIEDWVECSTPLCPLTVRHEGSLDKSEPQCLRTCFASPRLGGRVLYDGSSQECIEFCTVPELLVILSSIEALEDNETLLVQNVYQVASITEPRQRAIIQLYKLPVKISMTCMDPENYTRLPLGQLEEDNILRELNKSLLGYKQGTETHVKNRQLKLKKNNLQRRLSPIGESFSSTPSEVKNDSPPNIDSPQRRKAWLRPPSPEKIIGPQNRRGKFIVLGSSGECLPVSRHQTFLVGKKYNSDVLKSEDSMVTPPTYSRPKLSADSMYSSANSDDEEEEEVFHSARTSIDREENKDCSKSDEGYPKPNTFDIMHSFSTDNPEERSSFAQRLREALLRGATFSTSEDSSYAVGISVSGSDIADYDNIRFRRGTSTGFLLQEESLDDGFYQDSLDQEAKDRQDKQESDRYSFSTECSSDLEEIYEKFAKWLHAGEVDVNNCKEVVNEIANTLFKRALSDSYVMKKMANKNEINDKKLILAARSFSLELSKQRPELAAQLVNLLSTNESSNQVNLSKKDGMRPVATGNWGCGSTNGGDAQIKLVIQWLAGSFAGLPNLLYYTSRHHKLLKLDTVRRILLDREWTVGELVTSLLKYAQECISDPQNNNNLFDVLISANQTPI